MWLQISTVVPKDSKVGTFVPDLVVLAFVATFSVTP